MISAFILVKFDISISASCFLMLLKLNSFSLYDILHVIIISYVCMVHGHSGVLLCSVYGSLQISKHMPSCVYVQSTVLVLVLFLAAAITYTAKYFLLRVTEAENRPVPKNSVTD